ncbi:MAG: hypothetical protein IKJ27_00075 [Clostridia bacterium]|nr:hypothetical protein [Clostridia bacterium]
MIYFVIILLLILGCFFGYKIKQKNKPNNKLLKYLRECEEDPKNISLLGKLASLIIFFPSGEPLKNTIFENKYVKLDAALILLLYSIKKARYEFMELNVEIFIRYIYKGILMFYGATYNELSQFQDNRLPYFEDYLDKVYPNIDSYIDEATLLLRYDYSYNKYIEFTDSVPVIVDKDLGSEMKIQTEIKSYFSAIIEIIDKYIEDYEP